MKKTILCLLILGVSFFALYVYVENISSENNLKISREAFSEAESNYSLMLNAVAPKKDSIDVPTESQTLEISEISEENKRAYLKRFAQLAVSERR